MKIIKQVAKTVVPPTVGNALRAWQAEDWFQLKWYLSLKRLVCLHRLRKFKNKHLGNRCFVIGNGPSLNQMDLSQLREEFTFGMNRIYTLFPKLGFHTTYFVSVNKLVIEQCAEEIADLPMPKFLSWRGMSEPVDSANTVFLRSIYHVGFSTNPEKLVYESATVTNVALQLAYYMGFSDVILIGVDHSFTSKGEPNTTVVSSGADSNHFNPNYFGKGFRWQLPDLETSELGYSMARKVFERDGRRILDATVDGKLKIFPKVNYDDLFDKETISNWRGMKDEGGLKVKRLFTKKSEEGRPLVTIVTPVYNGETYLEETIQSIINQTYDNIEYIIIDGGSTDGTLDIIKKYEDVIAYWMSEPDKGVYDGINKGFKMATGEIFAWLNSDDKYYHSAVEMVVRVFNKYPKIEWITGIPTGYDEDGLIVGVGTSICYFRKFLRMGLYRGDILGWIQQESTFWRSSLWEKAGGLNGDLQFAADYGLWIRFSEHAHLYVIPTILGGFRKHPWQKSSNIEKYYMECNALKNIKFKKVWRTMRMPINLLSMLMALYKKRKKKEVL